VSHKRASVNRAAGVSLRRETVSVTCDFRQLRVAVCYETGHSLRRPRFTSIHVAKIAPPANGRASIRGTSGVTAAGSMW
jgi:hypothetical protein